MLADNLRNEAEEYVMKNGVLYKLWKQHPHAGPKHTRKRLAIPYKMRREFLEWAHDQSGHMGRTKTYDRLRQDYWWNQLYANVVDWVTTCDHCQEKRGHPTNVGHL